MNEKIISNDYLTHIYRSLISIIRFNSIAEDPSKALQSNITYLSDLNKVNIIKIGCLSFFSPSFHLFTIHYIIQKNESNRNSIYLIKYFSVYSECYVTVEFDQVDIKEHDLSCRHIKKENLRRMLWLSKILNAKRVQKLYNIQFASILFIKMNINRNHFLKHKHQYAHPYPFFCNFVKDMPLMPSKSKLGLSFGAHDRYFWCYKLSYFNSTAFSVKNKTFISFLRCLCFNFKFMQSFRLVAFACSWEKHFHLRESDFFCLKSIVMTFFLLKTGDFS